MKTRSDFSLYADMLWSSGNAEYKMPVEKAKQKYSGSEHSDMFLGTSTIMKEIAGFGVKPSRLRNISNSAMVGLCHIVKFVITSLKLFPFCRNISLAGFCYDYM